MAKKSGAKLEGNLRTRVARPLKATIESAPAPAPPPPKVEYAFPNKSRCPRCYQVNTECLSVVGPIQYRRCRQPICRHAYKVTGQAI